MLSCLCILGFLLPCCQINEPHLPGWNVSLNLPIAKKTYTLMEVLDKSTELKYYSDASQKNLIYYSKEVALDKITINDKLKIDGVTASTSETIGSITVSSDSIDANVGYSWAGSGLSAGMKTIMPPVNNQPITSSFNLASEFVSVKLESGTIDLTISNQFPSPVILTISNLKLKNIGSGEIIAQDTRSLSILPKTSGTLKAIAITPNLFIKNQIAFEATISCSGSNGESITLPAYSFGVKAKFNNLIAVEATAKIPQQDPVTISNSIKIDENVSQGTKYSSIKIDQGNLNINLANNIDLGASLTVTIENLKDASGKPFSETRLIGRKQPSQNLISLSLQNYTLVSPNGSPTNEIPYKIVFIPEITSDVRALKSTDGISGFVSISSLQLKEFAGILKPISVNTQRSSVSLDVKDLKNKFEFGQINLNNSLIQLRLSTTAKFELGLNGRIEASNNRGERAVMGLNSKTITPSIITPVDSVLSINSDSLRLFFMKFSILPDSLIIFAGGTLNPNYKTLSVKNTDQINGRSKIELPLDFGLQNAVFKDSLSVDLSNDDRDQIKKVNSLKTSLKLTNGLPASIIFSGEMYDQNNQFLINFPPVYSDQGGTITVNGATTNSNGEVATKNEQTISVKVQRGDVTKISKAKYMRVTMKINTSASGNSPVKFKTTDDIQIHAFGTADYQVKTEEN